MNFRLQAGRTAATGAAAVCASAASFAQALVPQILVRGLERGIHDLKPWFSWFAISDVALSFEVYGLLGSMIQGFSVAVRWIRAINSIGLNP